MEIKKSGLDGIIWKNVLDEIAQQGYSILENVLDDTSCSELMDGFTNSWIDKNGKYSDTVLLSILNSESNTVKHSLKFKMNRAYYVFKELFTLRRLAKL